MKLYSMFENDNLSELEFNHRKFCDLNNIKYSKFQHDNEHQKYAHIYRILEENHDQHIIFIDQNSWFKSNTFNKSLLANHDLLIVKHNNELYENFFIIKSTLKTRKIYKEILKIKSNNLKNDNELLLMLINVHMSECIRNMLELNYKNTYLNIDSHIVSNSFTENIPCLVQNIFEGNKSERKRHQFANILCNYKKKIYQTKSTPYEVINPGVKTAFVMLYTKNIENIGIISEINVARWCLKNNVSLYVYRAIPEELETINNKKMNGNWLKPHLLMRHFDDHQYVSWIDSDILITKDYKLIHTEDVEVYADPCNPDFNSGFMSFKTTEKNRSLLNKLIKTFNDLEDTSRIYVNGGDQKYFIDYVNEFYPNILVRSNHNTNAYPCSPFFINPEQPALIHFMGYTHHLRIALMDAYEQIISAS